MSMPTDQYELYAEFGIAAEKAQVLEVDAGKAYDVGRERRPG